MTQPTAGLGTGYFAALADLAAGVRATAGQGNVLDLDEAFERTMALLSTQATAGRKIMFVGNGGSAAIASHMAVDYWKNGGLRAVSFNDAALLTCLGNDYGYPDVFSKPVEMFAEPGDVLVAISSSGRSANILGAARAAGARGCRMITLSGFDADNPLRTLGEVNYYVPSKAYGQVEILHLGLCHCWLDTMMHRGTAPGLAALSGDTP